MCNRPLELFGEPVPPYFAMLAVGFALAIYLGARWADRSGLERAVIVDLGLLAIVWGVIGARLLHVIADGYFWDYVHLCVDPSRVVWHVPEIECRQAEGIWDATERVCRPPGRDCLAWAAFWNGGLTYYGGLAAASVFGVRFLRREGFPVWKAADMAGMVIPLGLFFGRLGCFLAGCCFGRTTESVFGLRFPAWSAASRGQWREGILSHPGLESFPVHATQLYEAAGCLVLAAGLMLGVHPQKRFDGQVLLFFLAGYASLRFGLEFLRADDRGGLAGFSTSQIIGLGVLLVVAMVYPRLRARAVES